MQEIVIRSLDVDDLTEDALATFERYQKTTQILLLEDGEFIYKEETYIDEWDERRKKEIILYLKSCMQNHGSVIGLYVGNQIKGFANLESQCFGERHVYCEMPFLHISKEYRGKGYGRKIFNYLVSIAVERNIERIYIASNPSVNTQLFYQKMGCVPAIEINRKIQLREPLDNQLEYMILKN